MPFSFQSFDEFEEEGYVGSGVCDKLGVLLGHGVVALVVGAVTHDVSISLTIFFSRDSASASRLFILIPALVDKPRPLSGLFSAFLDFAESTFRFAHELRSFLYGKLP
jgi:hypothetical protein